MNIRTINLLTWSTGSKKEYRYADSLTLIFSKLYYNVF